MVNKTLENFLENRQRTWTKHSKMMKRLQIMNFIRAFIKKKGEDDHRRNSLIIRSSLMFGT